MVASATAGILVFSPNGTYTQKSTLSDANIAADVVGKTVVVTTPLSAVQSNISSATVHGWRTDAKLVVEKGGSINPTTFFTGLSYVEPEWFGAKGDGTTDDTVAIQNAINSLSLTGGVLKFNAGHYKVTSRLQIGNGSVAGVSTYKPIKLLGAGVGGSPGNYLLGPTTFIDSYTTGETILVQGPINGWEIENICLNAKTTNAASSGLKLVEAQYGKAKNLSILNFYGISLNETTAGGAYLNYHNNFESTWILLPAGSASAIGISSGGTGLLGTAFETFYNTYIAISNAGQVAINLGFSDSNKFYNTEIVAAGANGQAIQYDYSIGSSTFTYRTSLPSSNAFFGLDVYTNSMVNYAPDGYGAPPALASNKIYNYSRTNSAALYHLKNLSYIDEPGVQGAIIQRNAALNIVNGSQKIALDTLVQDPDGIADITTNHRITPNKAGYYLVTGGVGTVQDSGNSAILGQIKKNGTTVIANQRISNGNTSVTGANANMSALTLFNGTTDYVELYAYQTGNTVAAYVGDGETYLSVIGPFGNW